MVCRKVALKLIDVPIGASCNPLHELLTNTWVPLAEKAGMHCLQIAVVNEVLKKDRIEMPWSNAMDE